MLKKAKFTFHILTTFHRGTIESWVAVSHCGLGPPSLWLWSSTTHCKKIYCIKFTGVSLSTIDTSYNNHCDHKATCIVDDSFYTYSSPSYNLSEGTRASTPPPQQLLSPSAHLGQVKHFTPCDSILVPLYIIKRISSTDTLIATTLPYCYNPCPVYLLSCIRLAL